MTVNDTDIDKRSLLVKVKCHTNRLTLKVLVATIDALGHFEIG